MTEHREWYAYKIGKPPLGDREKNDCTSFKTIHHNCHVDDAFRIFMDEEIHSSLVWDESKLRNSRTLVSWVSANTWSKGSIYGHIRFEFDWKALVEGKQFYWVEAKEYNPHAFRILIGKKPPSGVTPYNVESGDGPLFYDSKTATWYRNGEFTSEFMLDVDLPLDECTRVVFDDHHRDICRRNKSKCQQFEKRDREAGAELFARLVGHGHRKFLKLFLDARSDHRCLHASAAGAYLQLRKVVQVQDGTSGTITHSHPAAKTLVSAILDCYGFARPNGAAHLCNLFTSTKELRLAFIERLKIAFGVASEEALRGEEDF